MLSPDGKKLAFVSEGSVWVIPVHGKVSPDIAGEPVQLTEPMGAWDVMSFIAWSADGNWIAFNVSDEKEDAIYVVRSSGGVPKKVPVEPRLRNSGYTYRLSLSPDGKVLASTMRWVVGGPLLQRLSRYDLCPKEGAIFGHVLSHNDWLRDGLSGRPSSAKCQSCFSTASPDT